MKTFFRPVFLAMFLLQTLFVAFQGSKSLKREIEGNVVAAAFCVPCSYTMLLYSDDQLMQVPIVSQCQEQEHHITCGIPPQLDKVIL